MTRLVSAAFPTPHGMSLVQVVAKRQLRMHLRKIREREYSKLRSLVPAVASKKKVSKVQVIEEAVRYIEELHSALVERFREKHGCLAEDKAKETVQTFVERMMEPQQPTPTPTTTTTTDPNRSSRPSPFYNRSQQLHTVQQPVPFSRLYPTSSFSRRQDQQQQSLFLLPKGRSLN